MKKLKFNETASKHLKQLEELRSPEDLKLINELANYIDCKKADNFVIIPCHIKESGLKESLLAYKDAALDPSTEIIVFINASESSSDQEFQELAAKRILDIEAAMHDLAALKVQVLSHHFRSKRNQSRIRGVVTDALIKQCLETGIEDPILISNDADALAYAPNYLKEIRESFRNNELLDFASGPIFWSGCDSQARIRYRPEIPLPEVFLSDFFGQFGDEIYREYGHIYTTGCNSAFRLASVCAINGYDFSYEPSFDVEIGVRLKEMRQAAAEDSAGFSQFLYKCSLSTNPRRAFYAQLKNIPYGMQFDNFATVLGAELSILECIEAYQNSKEFLQIDELKDYEANKSKVHQRLSSTFEQFIIGEAAQNKAAFAKRLADRLGMEVLELDASSDRFSISFNWDKSTQFLNRIVQWAKYL
ncbi:MAG: hypothetical protein K2X27_27495 [Candidatus Obscuribacterales bacterium]|nr:hypothetical protein [Candidatus Obscuribacterales bacterium]